VQNQTPAKPNCNETGEQLEQNQTPEESNRVEVERPYSNESFTMCFFSDIFQLNIQMLQLIN